MTSGFASVAPYLTDPLTLVGFVALLFFSFFHALVRHGVIPQLTADQGVLILKRVLLAGTILAFLITALGFGLKYREMSKAEQQRVRELLQEEVRTNSKTLDELVKNSATNLEHFLTIAQLLRHERIPLLAMMFPGENLVSDMNEPSMADLADLAIRQVVDSGLLDDALEVKRAGEAAKAIRLTIDRTRDVRESLVDAGGTRYPISDLVLQAHLDVLRKIEGDEMPPLNQHYSEWRAVRRNYDVVNEHLNAYFDEVARFFGPEDDVVNLADLRGVLTAERFAYSVLIRYGEDLAASAEAARDLRVGRGPTTEGSKGSSTSQR